MGIKRSINLQCSEFDGATIFAARAIERIGIPILGEKKNQLKWKKENACTLLGFEPVTMTTTPSVSLHETLYTYAIKNVVGEKEVSTLPKAKRWFPFHSEKYFSDDTFGAFQALHEALHKSNWIGTAQAV